MKQNLVIVGIGTTAEHVYSFVKEYDLFNIIGFAVNEEYKKQDNFLGKPLFSIEELYTVINKDADLLFVAMLWNRLNADRKKIYEHLKAQGFNFANIISPNAKIRGVLTGDNCWFHDYTIVQHDAIIGSNVAVMAYSLIGAHVHLGSHCFLGAKSVIGGNCKIGEQCFIGINAIIFDDRQIGNKCIIGACTAVKRDIENYTSVKTSLDNYITNTYSEDSIENRLLFSKNQH